MPAKKIKLHVSANNNVNGVINVKVTPWRVRLDAGDVVEWELDTPAPGRTNNDILWFRVEQIDQVNPWPFNPPQPPDARYTALASGSGTVTSPPRNTANGIGDVISYGLTIGFRDDNNKLRTMYIDPDMVIDS
jgi:translation initiation factor IF-1